MNDTDARVKFEYYDPAGPMVSPRARASEPCSGSAMHLSEPVNDDRRVVCGQAFILSKVPGPTRVFKMQTGIACNCRPERTLNPKPKTESEALAPEFISQVTFVSEVALTHLDELLISSKGALPCNIGP